MQDATKGAIKTFHSLPITICHMESAFSLKGWEGGLAFARLLWCGKCADIVVANIGVHLRSFFQSEPDWQIKRVQYWWVHIVLNSLEGNWLGSQTYNYLTFTSQKNYLLNAHIFCEVHCPSLGKIDNIKSKTLQLGCDKLLVKWALSSGRGSDNGREDYGWVSFAKSPTSACRCARNIWEIKNQCKNNLDVYTICRNLF